jgi:hypothetical protein
LGRWTPKKQREQNQQADFRTPYEKFKDEHKEDALAAVRKRDKEIKDRVNAIADQAKANADKVVQDNLARAEEIRQRIENLHKGRNMR